jgi:MFS family permease
MEGPGLRQPALPLLEDIDDVLGRVRAQGVGVLNRAADRYGAVNFTQSDDLAHMREGVHPALGQLFVVRLGLGTEAQELQQQQLLASLLAVVEERSGVLRMFPILIPFETTAVFGDEFFAVEQAQALGTDLVPAGEAGRYLGISNLAGAGAGIVGAGIGGLVADTINRYYMGLGYFAVFAAYAVLFALSTVK